MVVTSVDWRADRSLAQEVLTLVLNGHRIQAAFEYNLQPSLGWRDVGLKGPSPDDQGIHRLIGNGLEIHSQAGAVDRDLALTVDLDLIGVAVHCGEVLHGVERSKFLMVVGPWSGIPS
jgi:hypothetical protein